MVRMKTRFVLMIRRIRRIRRLKPPLQKGAVVDIQDVVRSRDVVAVSQPWDLQTIQAIRCSIVAAGSWKMLSGTG